MDIVDCLDKLTVVADKRLNVAYQKARKNINPSGLEALKKAELAWLEYRKQRCYYISAGPGTIGQITGADCLLRMMMQRADELESDSKGLGPG
jgi:uncharacterized protein YecT (DUF1311 family)